MTSTPSRSKLADPYVSPVQRPLGPARVGNFGQVAPDVLAWFRLYSALMVAVSVTVMAVGVWFLIAPESPVLNEGQSSQQRIVYGVLMALSGGALTLAFVVGILSPREPWMWIHGLILLGLGMTSICLLQFTLPLFVYWLKLDVKAYFGAK